jgi:hypothetical protein
VEKYQQETLLEAKYTPPLYYDRAEAESLAARFAKGRVTPITLLEMAEEWADC